MNTKYLLGSLITFPLLPLMYFQGKRIRTSVPKLPEAKGPEGTTGPSPTPLRLLVIGESTIAGVGVATHEEGFTGTLARELANSLNTDISWKVYAKSGYTARKVCHKLVPQITETSADLIVIGLGGNDAFKLNRPDKWRSDVTELIQNIRRKFPETPIAFTNMPPIKAFPAFTPLIKFTIGNLVEILGAELEKIVSHFPNVYYNARKITLEDWTGRLHIDATSADFFSDGVHPSQFTYQLWAWDFAKFMISREDLVEQLKKNEKQ